MNVFLYAIFVVLGTILSRFAADIPPPNDSDLRPRQVSIAREDNAYYSLVNVQKALYQPTENADLLKGHLAGKQWDPEFVANTLSRNRKARHDFDEVTRKPQFQDPTIDELAEFALEPIIAATTIARVNSLAAENMFRLGKQKAALDETMKILKNGQKIQNSHGTVVHYLIAADMKRIGLERMQRIVESTTLSPDILISYARRLEKYKRNEAGLTAAFKHEYGFFTSALDGAVSEKLKSKTDERMERLRKYSFYFQPNKTKTLYADLVRGQISDANVPCGLRRNVEIQRLTPSSKLTMFATENLVGMILVDIATPEYWRKAHEKKCEDDFLVSVTQVLLALKAYKMETGRHPSSLKELVPQYMTRVPDDPFDGRRLRYSAEKKMIHS
ncbi:MAG: hypothetical protein ACE5KS_03330, partial [Woeseiaceae bacterium]